MSHPKNALQSTLGDKLGPKASKSAFENITLWDFILTSPALGLGIFLVFQSLPLAIIAAILCHFFFVAAFLRGRKRKSENEENFLLAADQQGFMSALKLADKTVLLDGNNIYHFGLSHDIATKALKKLADQMRREGFRVVCFFDASIYHTLRDNNAFNHSERFSRRILHRIFGLADDEIYIVPSGTQADKYIIETLAQMPKSFAITNDRFRDYQIQYPFLAKDQNWRKGMKFKEGELSLFNYRFKTPLGIKKLRYL